MANQDPESGRFVAGNFAAARHLARSDRVLSMNVQRIRRKVSRELRDGSKSWLLRQILRSEARVDAYQCYVDAHGGPVRSRGGSPRCLDRLEREEDRLTRLHLLWEGRQPAEEDDLLAVLAKPAEALRS